MPDQIDTPRRTALHAHQRIKGLSLGIGVIALLAGCGSGGSSTPPPPAPPINQIPTFSSSTAASTPENTDGIVYTAQASDPDGTSVRYSLLATGDNPLFTINADSGEVRFTAAPDFETPGDADADNIYRLRVRATDAAGGIASLDVALTVTDVVQTPVLRRKASGLAQPIYVSPLGDGSDRVLVFERAGRIRILNPDTGLLDPVDFADLRAGISTAGEGGLLGFAFAPDFDTSRQIYLNVTNLQDDTEIRRYTLMTGRSDMLDPASEDVILRIDQPFDNHNAGWIGFDANGFLMIPMGDGGSGGDPNNLAQNPQSLLGKVLRLDITGDDFPADPDRDYAIPAGNTYADPADGRPEIFALGLRNPYRSSFDPLTGDLLIADVGQSAIEEVSRLPVDDSSLNFGWRVKEGTRDYLGSTTATLTPPVLEYTHGTGPLEGQSITGGFVYQGPVEALQNVYLFADFISHNVWGVPVLDLQQGGTVQSAGFQRLTDQLQPDTGALTFIISFGLDAKNNLYLTTIGGDVFRLEAAN
ncbi:PQQ-dependent sugar dehydrogenase [Algimonas porphyrae]|uniref:Cadherin domain-containing protein n=1 Tax=Algimonas porphyrae TaxID=1128113 RepID=A0ABQ5V0Q1_9PROT|nr:PQQ-dependent sugar dehydrogenase [Algimonas porphyrae]GLQ20590.1 hypothetical protein GCM10007854_15450 [Algimonas porphyrae]